MTTLEAQLSARAKWDESTASVLRYAYGCRNREKRAYAIAYAAHKLSGAREPDSRSYDLSFMGAQAVRLAIHQILG